jgi:hypothetical protein
VECPLSNNNTTKLSSLLDKMLPQALAQLLWVDSILMLQLVPMHKEDLSLVFLLLMLSEWK